MRLKAECHVKGAERAWLAHMLQASGAAAVLPSSGAACRQALLGPAEIRSQQQRKARSKGVRGKAHRCCCPADNPLVRTAWPTHFPVRSSYRAGWLRPCSGSLCRVDPAAGRKKVLSECGGAASSGGQAALAQ